jgi:signal transduction histidine kinase
MVKKIIIAEGGSILFDSKEGEGSTFGFVFAKQKLKITKDDKLKVKSI